MKPLAEDLAGAEKALQEMLASPAPDPETVGNLVIAIHSGRLQIGDIQGVHRILAIGILDSDQQAKLNPLRLASFLRLAAQQAVSINLIGAHEPPQRTDGGPVTLRASGSCARRFGSGSQHARRRRIC